MRIFLLLWLFFIPTMQQESDDIIHVTVVGDDGRFMGGVRVIFEDETGDINGECYTKPYTGLCDIILSNTSSDMFIRGHLTVGSWGQRSVIWPGGELTLLVDVTELGFNHPPHEELEVTPEVETETAVPEVTVTATPKELSTETPTAVVKETVASEETFDEPEATPEPQTIIQQTEPSPLLLVLGIAATILCIGSIVGGMVGLLIWQSRKGQGDKNHE